MAHDVVLTCLCTTQGCSNPQPLAHGPIPFAVQHPLKCTARYFWRYSGCSGVGRFSTHCGMQGSRASSPWPGRALGYWQAEQWKVVRSSPMAPAAEMPVPELMEEVSPAVSNFERATRTIIDDVLAGTPAEINTTLRPSHMLEEASRLSVTVSESTKPSVIHASSPGHSTEPLSALSSLPDCDPA